jgi:pimeloyl-ACP methyl ester carboxylesterase
MRHRYPIASSPTVLRVNDVELCVDTVGHAADAAILLIMGSGASMDWWEDEFCARLADGGRFVIRYDHRDTGESVSYPPGAPGYTGPDLAADAVGVLDALGVRSAHLAGISMGGGIAQVVALDRPERVTALTLIATTAATGGGPELPGMTPEAPAAFAVGTPDWSDRQAVIDYMTQLARASASPEREFDEAGFREVAGRVFDRTANIESSLTNHDALDHGEPPRGRLEELALPTLVVHGRHDPLFPPAHGEALAARIPGARLLTFEAMGHDLPRETWDAVVPAILELSG